jgi:hypothetical protein
MDEPKFTYDDIVIAARGARPEVRPGERAWVVGVIDDRATANLYYHLLPVEVLYMIQFEDGTQVRASESELDFYFP